jgi:ribonuclease D
MEYVDRPSQIARVARRIAGEPVIAADTEAAGYHRYQDRICLLQLSTRTDTYLVDTLAVSDLEALAPLFADPAVEVVFHDADYDLRLLHRDFGIRVRGLFDTKIAAQFLGEPAIGLASLLEKYLGVHLEKKYQRADWAQRPLPPPLLEYASQDTRHLPRLRDLLLAALESSGRRHWAEEEFRLHEQTVWNGNGEDAAAYLRLKGSRDLRPRQLAALRDLYAWREDRARERDVASFRVVSNETLVELARRMPASVAEAEALPGLPRSVMGRYGTDLLEVIRRARSLPEAGLPQRPPGTPRPPPDPELDQLVERLKTARDETAEALGLDRGFLLPRHQLEAIARAMPRSLQALADVPGMRNWQIEAAGDPILRLLRG